MFGRLAPLAALIAIGASGVSLAAQPTYLGDWARADGKTKIHVASCGASVCARNTWVRRGSGEKVGDRLILRVKPVAAGQWSGNAYDPQRSKTYAINVRVTYRRMTTRGCVMDGFVCESMSWGRMMVPGRLLTQVALWIAAARAGDQPRQFTNNSTPAATSVAIATR